MTTWIAYKARHVEYEGDTTPFFDLIEDDEVVDTIEVDDVDAWRRLDAVARSWHIDPEALEADRSVVATPWPYTKAWQVLDTNRYTVTLTLTIEVEARRETEAEDEALCKVPPIFDIESVEVDPA